MRSFLNNWQLKILSVLAAAVLWIFVVGIENTVFLFAESLDIKPVNLSKNFTIQEKLPSVKVYLRTDGDIKKTLNKNDFDVSIDLAEKLSGAYDVPVLVTSNNTKITIVKIEPATVKVNIVPLMEKEVKVVTKFKGTPMKGFHLDTIETDIEKVKVKAAQSTLDKIQSVEAVVALSGLEDTTFKQTAELTLPENLGLVPGNIVIDPESVEVTTHILSDAPAVTTQESTEVDTTLAQTTVIVPIILSGANPDFEVQKIQPANIQVTVEGPQGEINKLKYDDISLTIDLAELNKAGEITIKPEWIKVPLDMKLKSWSPEKVTLQAK